MIFELCAKLTDVHFSDASQSPVRSRTQTITTSIRQVRGRWQTRANETLEAAISKWCISLSHSKTDDFVCTVLNYILSVYMTCSCKCFNCQSRDQTGITWTLLSISTADSQDHYMTAFTPRRWFQYGIQCPILVSTGSILSLNDSSIVMASL